MEITVNDGKKLVEVWLTNAEKNDSALRESLPHMYREYKRKGYLVAVFESGSSDLYDSTLSLLLHNREVFAKRDLEAEKPASVQKPA